MLLSIDPRRLLGFAFAGADLLVEIDPEGKISLALGAAQAVAGGKDAALQGQPFVQLFAAADQAVVEAVVAGLKEGDRKGPLLLKLADQNRAVTLTAHRMSGNGGRISVLLSRAACPVSRAGGDVMLSARGLESLAGTLIENAARSGEELELALVEFKGLDAACKSMGDEAAAALVAAVSGAMRAESRGGAAAARLTADRFAILRLVGESAEGLAGRVSQVTSENGAPAATARGLTINPAIGMQRVGKAIRFALQDFERDGMSAAQGGDLAEALNRAVQSTLARAGEVGKTIMERKFQLAYQPVVRLNDGTAHHHEVLVRFNEGESPFETIRLAEEFDLIEELDQAILDKVAEVIRTDRGGKTKLAVNVSGRTIGSDAYVDHLIGLLKQPLITNRLHIEITESSAIQDMERADRCIQAIRQAGGLVCLDDFGAGAASLSYLQKLRVDIVKIDGQYVRDLGANGRDTALISHLARLCKELKVRTVAEMVETAALADIVRDAGIDFAQGWFYGHPTDRPLAPLIAAAPAARRRVGAVESWG